MRDLVRTALALLVAGLVLCCGLKFTGVFDDVVDSGLPDVVADAVEFAGSEPVNLESAAPEPDGGQAPAATLAALEALTVKGRAPMTGYEREEFGPAWADVDRNGCDTRNDILARDLDAIIYKDGTKTCVVLTGTLLDPYTGKVIEFERGPATSTAVQIDHVVALADAWQKGAQQWDEATRRTFANDPENLRAADGPANSSKGAGDAATWLPPHKVFRCEYVTAQIQVKADYGLWVTPAEHDAMARVLAAC